MLCDGTLVDEGGLGEDNLGNGVWECPIKSAFLKSGRQDGAVKDCCWLVRGCGYE